MRKKDYSGQVFGRLTAIRLSHHQKGKPIWEFSCSCGKNHLAHIGNAVAGRSQSCGCLSAEIIAKKRGDLTGKAFGRLIVMEEILKPQKGRWWRSVCECGNYCISPQRNLLSGKTKSCGCLQREAAAKQAVVIGAGNATHGMTNSPEWIVWRAVLARCGNKKNPAYPEYGGRGIKVCDRWRSFENFFADMGPRPSLEYSIDRYPNQNGDYEPGNCRWATMTEQNRNRTNNLLLTVNGITKTAIEWIEETGLPRHVLYGRIRSRWPHDLAVLTPVGIHPEAMPYFKRDRK